MPLIKNIPYPIKMIVLVENQTQVSPNKGWEEVLDLAFQAWEIIKTLIMRLGSLLDTFSRL
jgi:hypothetical protein